MSANPGWSSPQIHPGLAGQDAHVWRASLGLDQEIFGQLESTLSERRARAGKVGPFSCRDKHPSRATQSLQTATIMAKTGYPQIILFALYDFAFLDIFQSLKQSVFGARLGRTR
jgi:hypothetical protein